MSDRIWVPDQRTRQALKGVIDRDRVTPYVHDPLPKKRKLPQLVMGEIKTDIAANETGLVTVEVGGDRTASDVDITVRNIHDTTLEQGLRVILIRVNGVLEQVPLPFDYSACEDPDSPQPIPIS
jgi:hypothetical protein